MEGREGGTWLGLSSSGKIASLLNILQPREEATKNQKDLASRGYLVVNYLRDDVMTAQGKDLPEILLKSLSRIFVTTANGTYGTRTTTIVLVGEDDKAVFHERTMRVPINPTNPVWDDVVLYHDLSPPRPQ
ncbi:hypothetical protein HAZT_HAZT003937 [Hyalella azteca]|uniref:Uncharacterized protein n=1 Tax=Hyalella azteca TaxID=294128 RepID=A0A6A0H4P7_HYAAZ|nr:hypothetical protein HAZT_HAZT003937 [Hyalella azteca]